MRSVIAIVLMGALSTVLLAQQLAPPFEAVSIKPTQPGGPGGPGPFVSTSPGRLQARGTLLFLIEFAHGIRSAQIEGGPGWVRNDRYDLTAVFPATPTPIVPAPATLQPVLADRFRLRTRRLLEDGDILALVVAGGGTKMKTPNRDDEPSTQGAPGRLIATRITMRQLAAQLARMTGRPVEDRTGLSGEFNLTLTWSGEDHGPDPLNRPSPGPDSPALSTALQEQLGLRIERARGSIEVLVIDSVARPTPD
jgi:uncharacterized protein (TIGR03435 family)